MSQDRALEIKGQDIHQDSPVLQQLIVDLKLDVNDPADKIFIQRLQGASKKNQPEKNKYPGDLKDLAGVIAEIQTSKSISAKIDEKLIQDLFVENQLKRLFRKCDAIFPSTAREKSAAINSLKKHLGRCKTVDEVNGLESWKYEIQKVKDAEHAFNGEMKECFSKNEKNKEIFSKIDGYLKRYRSEPEVAAAFIVKLLIYQDEHKNKVIDQVSFVMELLQFSLVDLENKKLIYEVLNSDKFSEEIRAKYQKEYQKLFESTDFSVDLKDVNKINNLSVVLGGKTPDWLKEWHVEKFANSIYKQDWLLAAKMRPVVLERAGKNYLLEMFRNVLINGLLLNDKETARIKMVGNDWISSAILPSVELMQKLGSAINPSEVELFYKLIVKRVLEMLVKKLESPRGDKDYSLQTLLDNMKGDEKNGLNWLLTSKEFVNEIVKKCDFLDAAEPVNSLLKLKKQDLDKLKPVLSALNDDIKAGYQANFARLLLKDPFASNYLLYFNLHEATVDKHKAIKKSLEYLGKDSDDYKNTKYMQYAKNHYDAQMRKVIKAVVSNELTYVECLAFQKELCQVEIRDLFYKNDQLYGAVFELLNKFAADSVALSSQQLAQKVPIIPEELPPLIKSFNFAEEKISLENTIRADQLAARWEQISNQPHIKSNGAWQLALNERLLLKGEGGALQFYKDFILRNFLCNGKKIISADEWGKLNKPVNNNTLSEEASQLIKDKLHENFPDVPPEKILQAISQGPPAFVAMPVTHGFSEMLESIGIRLATPAMAKDFINQPHDQFNLILDEHGNVIFVCKHGGFAVCDEGLEQVGEFAVNEDTEARFKLVQKLVQNKKGEMELQYGFELIDVKSNNPDLLKMLQGELDAESFKKKYCFVDNEKLANGILTANHLRFVWEKAKKSKASLSELPPLFNFGLDAADKLRTDIDRGVEFNGKRLVFSDAEKQVLSAELKEGGITAEAHQLLLTKIKEAMPSVDPAAFLAGYSQRPNYLIGNIIELVTPDSYLPPERPRNVRFNFTANPSGEVYLDFQLDANFKLYDKENVWVGEIPCKGVKARFKLQQKDGQWGYQLEQVESKDPAILKLLTAEMNEKEFTTRYRVVNEEQAKIRNQLDEKIKNLIPLTVELKVSGFRKGKKLSSLVNQINQLIKDDNYRGLINPLRELGVSRPAAEKIVATLQNNLVSPREAKTHNVAENKAFSFSREPSASQELDSETDEAKPLLVDTLSKLEREAKYYHHANELKPWFDQSTTMDVTHYHSLKLPYETHRKVFDYDEKKSDGKFTDEIKEAIYSLPPNLNFKAGEHAPLPTRIESGKVVVNYVANKKGQTAGSFIEKLNHDGEYQITVTKMPKEIDFKEIFCDYLIKQGLLNPAEKTRAFSLFKKMPALTMSELKNVLAEIIHPPKAEDELNKLCDHLRGEYINKGTISVDNTIPNTMMLDFAAKQIATFVAEMGVGSLITVCKCNDPLLMAAYILICKANDLVFEDETELKHNFTNKDVQQVKDWIKQGKITKVQKLLEPRDLVALKNEINALSSGELKQQAQALVEKIEIGKPLTEPDKTVLSDLQRSMAISRRPHK